MGHFRNFAGERISVEIRKNDLERFQMAAKLMIERDAVVKKGGKICLGQKYGYATKEEAQPYFRSKVINDEIEKARLKVARRLRELNAKRAKLSDYIEKGKDAVKMTEKVNEARVFYFDARNHYEELLSEKKSILQSLSEHGMYDHMERLAIEDEKVAS